MSVKENMQLMASYNQWMNQAMYKVVAEMDLITTIPRM